MTSCIVERKEMLTGTGLGYGSSDAAWVPSSMWECLGLSPSSAAIPACCYLHLGKQQVVTQVAGFLLPTWEAWI